MSAPTTPAQQPESGRGQLAYNLAGIVALVLLGAVGIAYLIDQAGRNGAQCRLRVGARPAM